MNLFRLFIEFLKIGAFSFGGGLATLPHIYDLAEKTGWYTTKEVTNMITISQATPGPLACNVATYVGFKLEGVLGSLIATISFIVPAVIFMGIVCKVLDKFKDNKKIDYILKIIRAAALAIIIDGSLTIFKIAFFNNIEDVNFISFVTNIHYKAIILAGFIYFLTKKYKISIVKSMFLSAIIGIIFRF